MSLSLFQPSGGGTIDSATGGYSLGIAFSLSTAATFSAVWFYSASGATSLPGKVAVWDSTQTVVASTSSPSWSGAAGSGWVRCPLPISLAAGSYTAGAVGKNDGNEWYSITASYWGSGVTNGILSCASQPNSFGGGDGSLTFPGTSYGTYNIWVDVEIGNAYTVWNGTIPSGTTSSAVARADGIQFTVNSACQLTGIAFYVPSGETNLAGSGYLAKLYSTTNGTSGTLVTSQAGGGTFTAGTWNWIPFAVTLTTGTTYVAVVENPDLLQFVHNYWAPDGSQGPMTVGPVTVPSASTALGSIQQPFGSAGSFPAGVNGSWYGIDIQLNTSSGASPSGLLMVGIV